MNGLTTGEVAKRAGVNLQTIRYYAAAEGHTGDVAGKVVAVGFQNC